MTDFDILKRVIAAWESPEQNFEDAAQIELCREEEEVMSLKPLEIKSAPVGNCEKCTYKKARGTPSAKCGKKCAESVTYFEWCHAQVYHVDASAILFNVGLAVYVDVLQIGYDAMTREIILPINESQYVAIQLTKGGGIDDDETAQKVLSHYNLQPRTNGEVQMRRNAEGNIEIISQNYDAPYLDSCFYGLDGEKVVAKLIGVNRRTI